MKDAVKRLIQLYSQTHENLNESCFQAQCIADELHVSRNLVSQYLNEMVQEGILVKTSTRPVFFYDKETLENKYALKLSKNIYDSIDQLMGDMLEKDIETDFQDLIGFRDSLHHAVEQCKSSVIYPPNGLPVLINGPTGTGKSMIAKLVYDYAIHHHIIEPDKKFVTLNCSEYANNPELLTANLFGNVKGAYTGAERENIGLIKIAEGGILFLDEVHCLRAECQEKLFLFMDKGIYHMVGNNEDWFHSDVRLIFATTENPETVLLKTLLRRIPITVNIPSLADRPMMEKKQLIYHILMKESKKTEKPVYMSNLALNTLMNTVFPGNVGGMKNALKAACANAFLNEDVDSKGLQIHIFNLPDVILQQTSLSNAKIQDSTDKELILITANEFKIDYHSRLIQLFEIILHKFNQLKQNNLTFPQFVFDCIEAMNKYLDHIMFTKRISNGPGLDFTRNIVDKVFSMIMNRYAMKISNNNIQAYSKYYYDCIRNNAEIKIWQQRNMSEVNELIQFVKERMSREYYIAKEICDNIDSNLDIEMNEMGLFTMMLSIRSFNHDLEDKNTISIILSHGYSTASSIADAANKLLGKYIFDAIDMQLDVSVEKTIEQLNEYLKYHEHFDELVLLVDMGSLEEIYKGIHHVKRCNIGIINNITTKLALEVGEGILKGKDIKEILDMACHRNHYTYHYVNNRIKNDAILTICATGVGAAEKITELITTSLPYNIPVEIMPYDYETLIECGIDDEIFQKYKIQMIVGTLNPHIEGIPFVAIEELVLNDGIDKLQSIFTQFLNEEGIAQFNQNILKNFTLNNIVNHLTILNASKVLEDVQDVVNNMEVSLGIQLPSTNKIGLYVHLSCLVERLITKSSVAVYPNLEEFLQEHDDFVKTIKNCFEPIELRYSVEIPSTELGYIYNYILF